MYDKIHNTVEQLNVFFLMNLIYEKECMYIG